MMTSASAPNSSQFPANMSPGQQCDTPSKQCHANMFELCDEANVSEEATNSVVERNSFYSDPGIKSRDVNSILYKQGVVGQIWALYDSRDRKPRSYVQIKRAGGSNYLRMLKYYPMNNEEKNWNAKELPVTCGKFRIGEKRDITECKYMYSHIVEFKEVYVDNESDGKNSVKKKKESRKKRILVYEIYPKKGEVWALYKGWSLQWSSDVEKHMPYEYEVVEIVSDMSDNGGATAIPLVRIKGFSSLFAAAMDKPSFDIPSSEVLRFSHRIPSYRITGHENVIKKLNGPTLEKDVALPEGILLLNSDCFPAKLDVASSVALDTYMAQVKKPCSAHVLSTTGTANSEVDPRIEHVLKENLLYGHSSAHKFDSSDNVQNQFGTKRKLLRKVYTTKKIAGKRKKCEEPDSLRSSLESPSMVQKIGVNKVPRSHRESSLISNKSTQHQQFHRTFEDTLTGDEVTYQEPVAMEPLSFQSAYNDIDIHGRKLDEGLTAPSSGCQKNRDAHALGQNTASQVPFIKTLNLWSTIEEMDVFKEFPQQPHFLPLKKDLPGLREARAFGLMVLFKCFVESISKSSIRDNERSFEEKKCILAELKTHGFDVQYFERLLDELIKVKLEYTKHLEEKITVEAEKLGVISSLSKKDSLLCENDATMAEIELKVQHLLQKVEHLRQKGQVIEEEKEGNEEKLSELNVVERSVQKALEADKRNFDSILAGSEPKRLT